jgi:transposase
MSTRAQHAATTPIPVQLSAPEFHEFIWPHLSRPKRGPQCKLGYHGVFNLILWVLYTGTMEVFARAERHPWQPCHPLHDRLQSLCQMGR